MINHVEAAIRGLAIHHLGNRSEDGDIRYSAAPADVSDPLLSATMLRYLTQGYKEPEFYRFHYPTGELDMHPVYTLVSNIFDDPSCLHEQSVHMARVLFDKSVHAHIKAGHLVVAYLTDLLIEDELTDAVAICKMETSEPFFQVRLDGDAFGIHQEMGAPSGKLDKACLILNVDREEGYRILNIDHSNRYREALYWRDEFLMLAPMANDYQQTKNYIQATKNFIQERMPKEFDTDRAEESAAMQRSFEYFKKNDNFKADEYAVQVFKDDKVVEAFQDYKEEFGRLKAMPLEDDFDISELAVNKQSRVFRSVIKLDRNFHIYVHGDKNKIMKGVDETGKKYYILYYEEEK